MPVMLDVACGAVAAASDTVAARGSVHFASLFDGTGDTALAHMAVGAYFGIDIPAFDHESYGHSQYEKCHAYDRNQQNEQPGRHK